MKSFKNFEDDMNHNFNDLQQSLTLNCIVTLIGSAILAWLLNGQWMVFIGSLVAIFFMYLFTSSSINNLKKYVISKGEPNESK